MRTSLDGLEQAAPNPSMRRLDFERPAPNCGVARYWLCLSPALTGRERFASVSNGEATTSAPSGQSKTDQRERCCDFH